MKIEPKALSKTFREELRPPSAFLPNSNSWGYLFCVVGYTNRSGSSALIPVGNMNKPMIYE
jgi:hypothetical protein